jgi:4-hydroxybenzoate polyprenyltransferase
MSPKSEDKVDPAALAVAAFVAAWPIFSTPGPFELWSFIVGATLLVVICSYQFAHRRTGWQSLAFGSVCALPSLLAYGFLREMSKAGWRLATEFDPQGERVPDTRVGPQNY